MGAPGEGPGGASSSGATLFLASFEENRRSKTGFFFDAEGDEGELNGEAGRTYHLS